MRDINDYALKYVSEPFEEVMVKIRKRTIIEQCMKYEHQNMLEVGCGTSPLFEDFEDFRQMTVVEPSKTFVANAQASAIALNVKDKVTIYHAFIEDAAEKLKTDEKQFDMIIMSSLLHEVDNPIELLCSIRNICSENTIVHINVPNAYSLHRLIAVECGMISEIHERSNQQILMQRYNTYDMPQLMRHMEKAGFQVENSGSYFIKPFTHSQMQKCLDAGIIDEQVLLGLDKSSKYLQEFGAEIYVNVRRKDNEEYRNYRG